MQQYKQQNSRVHNTIYTFITWILKDECVTTYIAPIKHKMHLINTVSVHGIVDRYIKQNGDT